MRILVTEDDLALADNLKTLLQQNNFSIDLSHDGEDGLFQIKEKINFQIRPCYKIFYFMLNKKFRLNNVVIEPMKTRHLKEL